jgi:hypothetical protein
MPDLLPQDLIDRTAEQELFRNLVSYQSPARILTICDGGGRGKSSLLKRLRYNCQHEIKPSVPSCLLELDKLGERDPSPFALAAFAATNFAAQGENVPQLFGKFNELNYARLAKNFTPFEDGGGAFRSLGPRAMGRAETATMYGGQTIGLKVEAQNVSMRGLGAPDFTDEQEQQARDRCVDAFFDDLHTICTTRPMVLLLDAWERCNLSLRQWIFEEMLGNHVLHLDANLRPDRLAVIIAGRPCVLPGVPYGLRPDELRPLFDSREDFSATVLSIKSLSEWENEHIREFMVNNGCPEPTESQINTIRELLSKGKSLEKIVSLVALFVED